MIDTTVPGDLGVFEKPLSDALSRKLGLQLWSQE
jgi:hypothetical protein